MVVGLAAALSAVTPSERAGWSGLEVHAAPSTVVAGVLAVMPILLIRLIRPSDIPGYDRNAAPRRPGAALWLAVSVFSLLAGIWLYATTPGLDMVHVELGGSVQPWPPALAGADLGAAISADHAFIVGYGTVLWMGATAALWVFWTPRASQLARTVRRAVVVVVVADLTENMLLTLAWIGVGPRDRWLDLAAVAATLKFSLLLPAVLVAGIGASDAAVRLVYNGRRFRPQNGVHWSKAGLIPPVPVAHAILAPRATRSPADDSPLVTASDRTEPPKAKRSRSESHSAIGTEQRWRRGYQVPDARQGGVGVCLSGGGIRSASLALGFLHAMRGIVRDADYLVSVSGGGYTAGAYAQLLTAAGTDRLHLPRHAQPVRDPRTAYSPGSPEWDHVRRHSSYIASTATQTLLALGVLARGLLASLLVLFGPAVPVGVLGAIFYHTIPLAYVPVLGEGSAPDPLAWPIANTQGIDDGFFMRPPAVWALAVAVAAATLLWLAQLSTDNVGDATLAQVIRRQARPAAAFSTQAASAVAIVVLAVPMTVWLAGHVISLLDKSVGAGVGGSVGVIVLSYLGSLASMLWRRRKTITDAVGAAGGSESARTVAVPRGLLQLLLVIASVAVLCFGWLMLFGFATITAASYIAEGNPWPPLWVAAVVGGVVMFVGGFVDESSLSLHPFYRRRLANAFASRSLIFDESVGPLAVPYDAAEPTTLHTYGRARPGKKEPFPEIVFAAAANLTGEERTPPGRSAVSFVMGADWCGGPDVGWVKTKTLHQVSSPRIRRDLTVQGAVALSGAAFASTMGRFSRWYQILLATSGARLGAWLPNPLFLATLAAAEKAATRKDPDGWAKPGLPHIRRLTYLLREVFNIHLANERLLQITDGGHYENLGVVELLRRRCLTIYCLDAGGDSPPTASGLAEAMALAESELGVHIELVEPFRAEPGTGSPLSTASDLAALNSQLSDHPVLVGVIHYPEASELPAGQRTGMLVVARALLWPGAPYPVLSYAAQHPGFPHDSTSDQWFDDGQFTAYTQLGEALGHQARATSVAPVGGRPSVAVQAIRLLHKMRCRNAMSPGRAGRGPDAGQA